MLCTAFSTLLVGLESSSNYNNKESRQISFIHNTNNSRVPQSDSIFSTSRRVLSFANLCFSIRLLQPPVFCGIRKKLHHILSLATGIVLLCPNRTNDVFPTSPRSSSMDSTRFQRTTAAAHASNGPRNVRRDKVRKTRPAQETDPNKPNSPLTFKVPPV